MDLPIAAVPLRYADQLCRACFKKLRTATATEAPARVNILEMPGLREKLSACISSIFFTTHRGSKYLCRVCFERVNEFYEFREMCLQSIRRFEETQYNKESEYVITFKEESIKSEGSNDNILPLKLSTKEEYGGSDVYNPPEIFEDPLANQEAQFNKEPIATEKTSYTLLSSELVIKEEYELNDQELVSYIETTSTILPASTEIFEASLENDNSRINSVQKLTPKKTALEEDVSAKNHVSGCKLNTTSSNENKDTKPRGNSTNKRRIINEQKAVQMSADDLETVVNVKNEPISNENEGELSSDDSPYATSSLNVQHNFHEEVSSEHEHGIRIQATYTASKTTRKTAKDRTKKKRYSCGKCQKSFNKEINFNAHIQKHEGLHPCHCTHEGCDKSLSCRGDLKKHQSSHKNQNSEHSLKPYRCSHEGCNKSFSWPSDLRKHQRRHANLNVKYVPERFHCSHEGCDKSYAWPEDLKKHQSRHENSKSEHDLKRFRCTHEGCDKSFLWSKGLRRHQIRHNDPNSEHSLKRFRCMHEGCDKSYAWPEYLQKHQSRHQTPDSEHGPTRYHCTHEGCDKTFSWSNGLKRHLKRHDILNSEHGPERFICTHEGCDKSFAWRESLKTHQMRHEDPNSEHGSKRFHCTHEGCDKSYAWPEYLKNHQSRHKTLNTENDLKTYENPVTAGMNPVLALRANKIKLR